MRYLIAAAVLAAAVLLGWPAAAAPPSCAEPGRHRRRRPDVPCARLGSHVHAQHDVSRRLSRPTGADRLHHAEPRRIRQRRAERPGAATSPTRWTPPPSSTAPVSRRTTPAAWCSSSSRTSAERTRPPGTRRSTTTSAPSSRSPSTTCSRPAHAPLDSIFPIVQRDLERQNALGAAILPSTGLDPSHYQNFAITDDQLIFYFAPGEMLPAFAGATPGPGAAQRHPAAGDLVAALRPGAKP